MEAASKTKLSEMQTIISKMPFEVLCVAALPEIGVRWRDVSRAVRNARLPMTSVSVARVLRQHVAKALQADDVEEIVTRLRLKLIATQQRQWHLIKLLEATSGVHASVLSRVLASRVTNALRKSKRMKNMRPEVQTVNLDDMVYMSVQLVSESRWGAPLFVAVAPGEPVACVSTLAAQRLIKACVEGLGFKTYEDAKLHGRDIRSLLRIYDRALDENNVDRLARIPEYAPMPLVTKSGIDYTYKNYDSDYVDNIIGPDPPLLTDLNIQTYKPFFDPSKLKKKMSLTITLKSDDVAKTLKAWVAKKAIAPTSDFFKIFHQIKSNKFTYEQDE